MAIVAAIIGAGLSAGLAYASQPNYTDPASSSKAVSRAQLRALPGQRAVEQAARLGTRVDYPTGQAARPVYEQRSMSLKDALDGGYITRGEYNRYLNPTRTQGKGGVAPPSKIDPTVKMIDVRVPTGWKTPTRTADFTGYGDADIQGRLARDMAEMQLELQRKYGADFTAEARRQQELADPEGTEARRLLSSEINRMEDERLHRQRPVASGLDTQIIGDLERGSGVGDESLAEIERVLQSRGAGSGDLAGIEAELESGPEGEARRQEREQRALAYLSSGVSPRDADYREKQQSLANMADFLAGRTPQSQFSNLSGGQQGATPQMRGPSLPGLDPNAQQNAQQAGLQSYGQGIRATAGQVSPWLAGIGLLARGAQTAAASGAFQRN